jgi:signal transduction histidine kinase
MSNRFNWSKIHLIYFALALCDLLAVLSGLWISEYTKTKFQDATHLARYGDLVRDNNSVLLSAAILLSKPANSIFQTKDPKKAREDLVAYSNAFDVALTTDQIGDDTRQLLMIDVSKMRDAEMASTSTHLGLGLYFPDVHKQISTLELSIKNKKAAMVWESGLAIKAYEAGDLEGAAKHMDASDGLFRSILGSLNAMFAQSANINKEVTSESQRQMAYSTSLQYAVGSFIVLMICFVCAYGFFVGKVLKRKYADLELAKDESVKFNTQLQSVNDDVTRLNVSLAANMEQLKEAQNEIIRKGKMAQLGQLTATVAHEIRNPLGAARTSAYLLERKIKGKDLGVEPQLDRINGAITRCDNIITQLLDFSRARMAQCQELSLDDWLTKIVEEEAAKLPTAVAVTLELDAGDQKVRFDPDRMQRVIVNLIHNAAEAMMSKSKDGTVSTSKNPKITITCGVVNGCAAIAVKDNGPGISSDILPKILDPLFTTKSFGTGLGLPAVENIMHQHGGKLEIKSELGKGSAFVARWPVGGPPEQGEAHAA